VSITQDVGDDPPSVLIRQIMGLFDEYQSKENAKHVLRALKENARQGFWNGSLPPIGYRVVEAETRGAKVKKKLEIDPLHADTIRLIYRLALEGDGEAGQMGIKAIVKYLNSRGIFTRDGGRWGIGQVHRVLTRHTYIGEHQFNKRSKARELKPEEEVITVQVLALVERETFDAVQALLQARNPETELPARVVIGPTLLTGICYCGNCGGAMTIRTGKGGRYRYYACSIKARQGETGCKGRAISAESSARLGTARRGRGRRDSHHGIEDGIVEDAYCWPSAAVGGGWRAQKRTEVAEGVGLTSNLLWQKRPPPIRPSIANGDATHFNRKNLP
jgi:hypothetical protein